jgi:hypothetical protein
MNLTEYDLFPTSTYAGDPEAPIVTCKQCGCLVANTFEARSNHVRFHNVDVGTSS